MFHISLVKQFARLAVGSPIIPITAKKISTASVLQLKVTDQLWAEPLKKKKKMDPAIIKAREERRRKKIEKQIRRLEKNAKQLKPIDECEPPLHILDSIGTRKRPEIKLSTEVTEARALLNKDWCRYKRQEYMANIAQVDRIMRAQRRALDQLYEVSEELYNEAIMPDLQLIPYSVHGTYATPPIKKYDSPDGEYADVSKKWGN